MIPLLLRDSINGQKQKIKAPDFQVIIGLKQHGG
jgi:hypothetical protein